MADSVKLLGLTIYFMLKVNKHVQTICKKASNRVKRFF